MFLKIWNVDPYIFKNVH